MKKNNRLIYVLIVLLVIWNIVLSVLYTNSKKEDTVNNNVTNVEEVTVTNVTGFSTDLTEVVDKVKSSIVTIDTTSSLASGFIYKYVPNKAYVVTAFHAVEEAPLLKVIFASGASYDAKIIGKDIYADVAVLEVESPVELVPVLTGDSDLLKDGEFVVTIGTPKSLQYVSSSKLGIVSSKLRTIINSIEVNKETYEYYTSVIQLDSDVSEGYSGSPIFNMNGEVEGIITMKDDEAVFALPMNEVKLVADKIINKEEFTKIQFGIKGNIVTDLEKYERSQLNIPLDVTNGYYVNNVKLSSLGFNLGLKQGDIIISINGMNINTYEDLLNIQYTEANEFRLEVVRENERIELIGSIND